MATSTITSPALKALTAIWRELRWSTDGRRASRLPDTIHFVVSDRGSEVSKTSLGAYAVRLGRDDLTGGASYAVDVLLHRATHVLADHLDIRVDSDRGRYHNADFARVAAWLGVQVDGTSKGLVVSMDEHLAGRLAGPTADLEEALTALDLGPETRGRNLVKVQCTCKDPKVGRFAPKTLDRGKGILCGDCGSRLRPA